jgi:spermidine synthase
MQTNLIKPSKAAQFISACFLLGFSSMVTQIILFREMMVAFYGNELCLGAMLSVWLFWVGFGSYLGNKIAGKEKYSTEKLSLWYFLISVSTLVTIIFIRFSRQILGTAPAEIVGFFPMFLFAFMVMSFLCLVLGITFVLNSKSWTLDETRIFLVNRVYLWESLGAGVGGFLVTFLLIPHMSNFFIAILIFFVNLIFCALLLNQEKKWRIRVLIWSTVFLLILFFSVFNFSHSLDIYSGRKAWKSLPLVYSKDTKYGNISVTKQYEQVTFYENGLMLFSYPDVSTAEEAVHFALLEHPHPLSLLLIGGGLGGALSQALKYDSLTIDYVELDPQLIRTGEEQIPAEETKSLINPRVSIHYLDGRLFVKDKSKQETRKRYDVIIINLTDPYTAQLNRFFTVEFFEMTRTILDDGGVFSFRVSSAENYISPELGLYLSSIYRTLSSCFAEVKVFPGSNNIFLASKKTGILFDDWQTMIVRLKQRAISTQFVNENFLPDRLSPARMEYLRNAVMQNRGIINHDLKPICYFYNGILWSKQFRSFEKPVLLFLSQVHPGWLIGAILIIFLLIFLPRRFSGTRIPELSLNAIFVVGFTSITVEIILFISFQIFYGYLYSMMGLIFTFFMLGLTMGAFITQKTVSKTKICGRWLVLAQILQVSFIFVLLIIVRLFSGSSLSNFTTMVWLFSLIMLSGLLGGMLFTWANHAFLMNRTICKSGTGYAVDLFGSSLGSILASAILIPLLGIPATLILILLTNLVCLGFLLSIKLK